MWKRNHLSPDVDSERESWCCIIISFQSETEFKVFLPLVLYSDFSSAALYFQTGTAGRQRRRHVSRLLCTQRATMKCMHKCKLILFQALESNCFVRPRRTIVKISRMTGIISNETASATEIRRLKWRIWRNVGFVSLSFMCFFAASGLVSNLQVCNIPFYIVF